MSDPKTPPRAPANDDQPVPIVRRVPVIGEIGEGGAFRLYPAAEAWLRRRGLFVPTK